ncbi:MAG: transcriptional repressor LexA [Gemmatimonadota bacterium]|nr:transcriptional repressor LexA [Gemmatimonadota bacterium]
MAYTPPGQTRDKIFEFVRERILNGTPPSTREVQKAFGFRAVQSARQHLEALVLEGRLVKESGKARSHRLPKMGSARSSHLIPVLGRVQAGDLTAAIQNPEDYLPVQQTRYDGAELFALTIQGDSMLSAGILHGDTVIVRRQQAVRPGDIVVAMVGEEATVKRYREKDGRIELHPENDAFESIIPREDGETFSILGKVIEVRRYIE